MIATLLLSIPANPEAGKKLKKEKFQGTIVSVGPTAMTVRSLENIYRVRTFQYDSEVKKRVSSKKLIPGKKVTVHYYQGTSIAAKVD